MSEEINAYTKNPFKFGTIVNPDLLLKAGSSTRAEAY